MKKILAILLAVMMLMTLASCKKDGETEGNEKEELGVEEVYIDAVTEDKFFYELNEEGAYDIIKFSSKDLTPHKIEIPSEIDNVEVTGIAKSAFKANNQISEVVIPDTVTRIDTLAFFDCRYLETVIIPDSVKEIGECAFYKCISLKTLKLSSLLKVIPASAFQGCISLEEVTIPASVETIENGAFMLTALKTVVIPKSVKTIYAAAFYGIDTLEKAVFEGNEIELESEDEDDGTFIFSAGNENFTVVAAEDSDAAKYAAAYGYKFEKAA